jgi:hypothetical protein
LEGRRSAFAAAEWPREEGAAPARPLAKGRAAVEAGDINVVPMQA